jgi:hypothetical protein
LLVLAMLTLVLAQVLTQAVGNWHRIWHGAAHPTATDRGGVTACDKEQTGKHESRTPAFGHEAGSQACTLLDALAHAAGAPVMPSLEPAPIVRERVLQPAYRVVAVADVPAAARGPPSFH